MRAIRLVFAVLVGLALAAAPITTGLAMHAVGHSDAGPMAARSQQSHQDIMGGGASDDACTCCDVGGMNQDSPSAFCPLKCCGVAAILIEIQTLAGPHAISGTDAVAAALSPFSRQPDTPPPRS
jgi:hypothetical protein